MQKVTELEQYFAQIPDKRRGEGKRYKLSKLLTVIVICILNDAHGYREMARFMKNNLPELKRHFSWDRDATPSYELLRTLLNTIDFTLVNQAFINWVNDNVNLEMEDWVAFDGKAIRSTITDYNQSSQDFINVVTAFNHRLEVSLDQQSFHNKKSHEGQAITDILSRLNQVGLVMTMDALHCQKNT